VFDTWLYAAYCQSSYVFDMLSCRSRAHMTMSSTDVTDGLKKLPMPYHASHCSANYTAY